MAQHARHVLDLDGGIFTSRDPKRVAASLKRSADRSKRRKSDPYRSTMPMPNFYINRGARNLPNSRKRVLERAKNELRRLYRKSSQTPNAKKRAA